MARDQTNESGAPKPPGIVLASFLFVVGLICPFAIGIWAGLTEKYDELALLYYRGDFARLEQLARQGDPNAETWMGRARKQQGRRAEAIEWLARAGEKEDSSAIYELARIHEHMENGFDEALRWYRRGAELGNTDMQRKLAQWYLDGGRVPRDEQEAFRFYVMAAQQRESKVYRPLAKLYAGGIGTGRDPVEAYAYVELALKSAGTDDSAPWNREESQALEKQLAAELSSQQIDAARQRARERRPDIMRQ
jgi:TPR repeat protein